ncbi:HNH endonuclease signature motif containing protein [Trebonia kvetii]|nr:HNH endonuclease signature motif containing protein [Trebonia kvetii]
MNERPPSRLEWPPAVLPDPDPEWAEYVAWLDRESAAGRDPEPMIWAGEQDEAESAWPTLPSFDQGEEADVLPPGALLAGLTDQAVRDLGRLADSELIGVLQATRRQIAREQYKQVLVTAEYGRRRRDAFQDALNRGVPAGCAPGGFPGEELAMELVTTRAEAGRRIDDALDLTSRLPQTLAGMAAGQIDEDRAGWIALYTRELCEADAARAEEILAADAPDLRADQLARKAAAMEMKLAPEAVRARSERAKRTGQRVEARREPSGNASLSGREMDTADVMASKAHIDALAMKLRAGGLPGPLGTLRVLALADLTQGRDPLDRLTARDSAPPESADAPDPDGWPGWGGGCDDPEDIDGDDSADAPAGSARPADPPSAPGRVPQPMPALINLIVPAGTLLGWSNVPAMAGAWSLLEADETRTTVSAAASHPRTRWCVTLTATDGTALAHACARGQHPRLLSDLEPQPPPARLAALLRRLSPTFTLIASDACDHAQAEDQYAPSRRLKHLVRARSATCDAPGCQAQAVCADLDQTLPWPDGPTEQCNLAPRCRTHHRAKQAPDWRVEQPVPGLTRWTLPSGRTHVTTATRYDC